MARSSRKRPSFSIPPQAAIIGSVILGLSYFGSEVYKHHYSYHQKEGIWQSCFTPNPRCQQLILNQINQAQQSILLEAYSFTDNDIIEALINAQKRNVRVQIILDHSNLTAKNSGLKKLLLHKVPLRIDKPLGIAHNKVIIFDDRILLTGSYNFSNAAYKRNAENILIIHDRAVASEYTKNWQNRWSLSLPPSTHRK